MKILSILSAIALAMGVCHASDAIDHGHGMVDGKWVNIYVGNPNLAGVRILQSPAEHHHAGVSYKGKHPFLIAFVMWDGTVNETYYAPDGRMISAGWWSLKNANALDPKSFWSDVDFRYGSDPSFTSHRDPRRSS
jgi:hypothetical protein